MEDIEENRQRAGEYGCGPEEAEEERELFNKKALEDSLDFDSDVESLPL